SVGALDMTRRHRNAVEQAEAHRSRAGGMVSGGPHQHVGATVRLREYPVGGLDRSADRQQRRLPCMRTCPRLGADPSQLPGGTRLANRGEVLVAMDQMQLLLAREPRSERHDLLTDPRSLENLDRALASVGALGMRDRTPR